MQTSPVAAAPGIATDALEPVPPSAQARREITHAGFWPSVLFAVAATSILIGIIWDISWHISIGRDTFWTPAHMAVYLGGLLGGFTGGWLALRYTFFPGPNARNESVSIFGVRAPLGAWVTMWGAVAMLTSAPFDDWWHNAYGLDVRIISPPHTVLGIGMIAISVGALLVGLAHQNRANDRTGNWLFTYIGAVFVTLGSVFSMELTFPNLQHAATFYEVCAAVFVLRLVTLGVAGRISWPTTRVATISVGIQCLATWILPLFHAQPKLAPIFNPVTHMVPPAFPVLIMVPAVGIDLLLQKTPLSDSPWKRVLLGCLLGTVFIATFIPVQWLFAEFLLTPHADNWFFAGDRYWGYQTRIDHLWTHKFFRLAKDMDGYDPLTPRAVGLTWLIASVSSWLGVVWGGWMKRVHR
ncbi:conserved hypothetical protein [Chthoniobacter flavus Ellin428]|uniref:Uncharacterized protein n=1 Tax=Chthoniobacter flavus Ellin428 TaxID=497964 RepID=B4DBA0_9BACT|nr:hypothetical protein [Chthoniobacter flavus]EDY16288.1 conserved hypothetical protein [Chthoniobacter flavus Ellin428]TCO84716.1 hypothetical protein EV701_13421 [Chthoniobacter flavus]